MAIEINGNVQATPVLFIGDLKNKTAQLVLELTHVETNRALGQVEVRITPEAQPATDTQEATVSWDDFMAANVEGQQAQKALAALAVKMAPLSKVLVVTE